MEKSDFVDLKAEIYDLERAIIQGRRDNRRKTLLKLKYLLSYFVPVEKNDEFDSLEKVSIKKLKEQKSRKVEQLFFKEHPGMYN